MKPSLVLVGLGNPGKEYRGTRHNVGYQAIEALAEEFGEGEPALHRRASTVANTNSASGAGWKPMQKFLGETLEARLVTAPILLVKPTTFMNRSGEAVKKILTFYKLPASQCLVLCDDIDLPVGEVRLRGSGGAGSHNGLKSIVEQIGEDFPRLRIGILGPDAPQGSFAKAGMDLSAYVLSKPSAPEAKKIAGAIKKISPLLRNFVLGEKVSDR